MQWFAVRLVQCLLCGEVWCVVVVVCVFFPRAGGELFKNEDPNIKDYWETMNPLTDFYGPLA